MLTLDQFKTKLGVDSLGLYKSTKSNRYTGSVEDKQFTTVEDIDLKKEMYVYPTMLEDEEGGVNTVYFISNKKQRDFDATI
jgi:hypothetical protein